MIATRQINSRNAPMARCFSEAGVEIAVLMTNSILFDKLEKAVAVRNSLLEGSGSSGNFRHCWICYPAKVGALLRQEHV